MTSILGNCIIALPSILVKTLQRKLVIFITIAKPTTIQLYKYTKKYLSGLLIAEPLPSLDTALKKIYNFNDILVFTEVPMNPLSISVRTVATPCGEITYTFERKKVKNINLRVKHNGNVYVSAPKRVPVETADEFVISRSSMIQQAITSFAARELIKERQKSLSDDKTVILGNEYSIVTVADRREYAEKTDDSIVIHMKNTADSQRKINIYTSWLKKYTEEVFLAVMHDVHTKFVPLGIDFPQLKIRSMTARWGSCHTRRKMIVLNRRMIEAPLNCISHVVTHEFCHFIHPDHSRQFYALLDKMCPTWREDKKLLEKLVIL